MSSLSTHGLDLVEDKLNELNLIDNNLKRSLSRTNWVSPFMRILGVEWIARITARNPPVYNALSAH